MAKEDFLKGSIPWKRNFYEVFKLIKKTSFWGKPKKQFVLHIPKEIDELIEQDLKLLYKTFETFDEKGMTLTKRKYILCHVINSMGLTLIDGELRRPNKNDILEEFTKRYSNELHQLGIKKEDARKKS
jgi:hypothetical protein